jgi:hypothetical protein
MLNAAVGTRITYRSAILAEVIVGDRNFVSIGDLQVRGRLQNHTEITACFPRQNSVYP